MASRRPRKTAQKKPGDFYKGQGTFTIPKLPRYIRAFVEYLGSVYNQNYDDMLQLFEQNWEDFQATGKPRKKRTPKEKKATNGGSMSDADVAAANAATHVLNSGVGDEDVVDKLKHVAVVSKLLEENRDQVENASSLMHYARERNTKVDNAYRDLMDALDANNKNGAVDKANALYQYAKVPETELDVFQEHRDM